MQHVYQITRRTVTAVNALKNIFENNAKTVILYCFYRVSTSRTTFVVLLLLNITYFLL